MYLYGASGHCKVIIEVLQSAGLYTIDAIHDDDPLKSGLMGIAVKQIVFNSADEIIIAIGNNLTRKKIAEKLTATFLTAVHKASLISPSCSIGEGTVIMPGAIVNADAVIGQHCIINTAAVIEHDCIIGNYAHISPNAALAGNVTVGEGSQIGIGSCVIEGITIGKWVTIGAGSVIINNIPDYAVVVGNPGRIVKYKEIE